MHMTKYRVSEEVEELAPNLVGVSPQNRGGAHPNMQVVQRILKSFQTDGYDPSRHLVGTVVRCTSETAKAFLVEHNKKIRDRRPSVPAVDAGAIPYGSLAGSHLTIAMHCVRDNLQSASLGCSAGALMKEDEKLSRAASKGLKYWVPREDTPHRRAA